MNKYVRLAISVLVTAIIGFGIFYFWLPALNLQSQDFWMFMFILLVIFGILFGVLKKCETVIVEGSGGKKKIKHTILRREKVFFILFDSVKLNKIFTFIVALPLVVVVVGGIISSVFFNANGYASVITVDNKNFAEDMPEKSYVSDIALMDTDSARILGERELGALAKVVSQFKVGYEYTQINYQGTPQKVANLDYDGFFKWINNRDAGIPGYIMVDAVNNSAKYVELKETMKYSEEAYFQDDLYRAIRFAYPTKIIGNISFEVNEEGQVYYVVSCMKPKVGLFGALDVSEVILFNPVDGSHQLLQLDEVPAWIDIVYDGYLACEKYDWQGNYSGGFWNSIITKQGCKVTTADFGYIMRDDDVWYFTGVTSVTADASNIGFILSNARTGEYKFYSVIGAEEYSAMGAAEGEVQEKGYNASFPSLINVLGEPSYIMVLKDANGLVKLYALVNVEQYNVVATGKTQQEAIEAYQKTLAENGIIEESQIPEKTVIPTPTPEPSKTLISADVVVENVTFINSDGKTLVYITSNDNKLYKMQFSEKNELILLVKSGDSLKIEYYQDGEVNIINSWKKVTSEGK